MIPEKSKSEKLKKLSENQVTLKQYLANYKATFENDIDEMWEAQDLDKNGYLDRQEARKFVSEIQRVIDKERA